MKIEKIIILIAIIEIALLVNMPTANSYQINEQDKIVDKKTAERGALEKIGEKTLTFIIGFFAIKQIGIVSAEDIEATCCLEKNNGEACVDFIKGTEADCKYDFVDGSCSQISSCEKGCCIEEEEGLCSPNTIKQTCLNDGGRWENEESCAITECQKGCCILGDETQFVQEGRCEAISKIYGVTTDFKQQVKYELDCLALAETNIRGACVYFDSRCEIITQSQCTANKGEFYENYLCSNSELNSSCERQSSVGCFEGKDEIYWFDSCGNRENIYDADLEKSWNNGKILEKNQSCGAGENNANSESCGNCNYFLGSLCSESSSKKIQDGNFICKDMSCIDENNKKRANGESWCVYDGFIGDGKDVVGSRHWKRACIDGEIKSEGCFDYRTGICVQASVQNNETLENFTSAGCVLNEADICMSYNGDMNTMTQNCYNNKMCVLKQINIADGFAFDICVGQYPKGFDLSYENGNSAEADICSGASQTCTVVFEKKVDWGKSLAVTVAVCVATAGALCFGGFYGDWKCLYNCGCIETNTFAYQMNDLCISLGDCGSYVNIVGEGTDNIEVGGTSEPGWAEYVSYATPVAGQHAEPNNITDFLIPHSGNYPENYKPEDYESVYEAVNILGQISGGLSTAVGIGQMAGIIPTANEAVFTASNSFVGNIVSDASGLSGSGEMLANIVQTQWSQFINVGIASIVFSIAVNYLIKAFGLQGDAAMIVSVVSAVGTIAIATAVYFSSSFSAFCGPLAGLCFVILLIIMVIIMGVLKLFGIGDTEEVDVTFSCLPWEAPFGGDKCSVCNDDALKPCTKYRCESLGQACKIINEDSENPTCEKIEDNHKPATITPNWTDYGFNFANEKEDSVSVETDSGNCIPEFFSVKFGLISDEPAQCRFEFERKNNFSEMNNYPLELNYYGTNHTFGIMAPSIDSLSVYGVTGDIKQKVGNLTMYIRCQDYYGDINEKEYAVNFCITTGQDITPALIEKYSPSDGSYLKYGTTESPLTIYLNEPAECRWDKEDRNFEIMSSKMNCSTDLRRFDENGWPCNTTLTGLTNFTNSIFIKCKDQPWLEGTENASKRNINVDGYKYTLYKSSSELKIDYVNPSGDIETGFVPASLDFEVKTSGGAEKGISACYYDFEKQDAKTLFKQTFSNVHKQNINLLMNGPYTFYIRCEDSAGNSANGSTNVNIKLDDAPPVVTRAYEESGNLILQTDEKAECYFSKSSCIFDIKNSTEMTIGYSQEHRADWEAGITYYIKCLDIWGNKPNECSIKLLPNFFISTILIKFINKNYL